MKLKVNHIFFSIILMIPFLLGFNSNIGNIDSKQWKSTKANIKSHLKKMVKMDGGKFTMGALSNFDIRMLVSDSTLLAPGVPRRKSIDPFYISATEVTNGEWREFYQDKVSELGKALGKKKYYPDTSLWINEFPYSYNEPMAKHYFSNPKYNDYPVVGITWGQATAYCQWKSDKLKVLLDKKGIQSPVKFRLPTEAEWEYAAIKIERDKKYSDRSIYTWPEEDGIERINELTNIGQIHDINKVLLKQYADDGCQYTCEVASYPPNSKGLYDMGGNVSEWTSDKGYAGTYDRVVNKFERLESLSEIEKEIARRQKELGPEDYDAKIYLERLIHDRKVFRYKDIKICKGGSWEKGMIYAQTGSRQGIGKDMPSTKLGFRVAISEVNEDVVKYFPKKSWKPKK